MYGSCDYIRIKKERKKSGGILERKIYGSLERN
jgi:hypothetical protein